MTTGFTSRHPRLARTLAAGLLALVALFAAVWAAPRASGTAASWVHAPSVRLHTLRAPGDGRLVVAGPSGRGAGAPVTLDAGMRFSMAGVVCDVPSAGAVTVRLRTSLDGTAWGRWYAAPLEIVDEASSATAFIDPVWTGDARYVQVAAAAGSLRGPAALSGVRLVAIDPTESSSIAARVTGALRRVAATVSGIGLEQPALAASSTPTIVTRAEWGADEKLRSGSPSYSPVKMAFVHHTASGNTYSQADAPALVRGVYAYHTKSLGWSDIGYNFLIDRFGTIYEGRYGGISRGVVGAQVYGFNTGSTGISVMGTFSDEAPPAAAVSALERLLAWKLGVHHLDPSGTARLTCGATEKFAKGKTVRFPVIAGHRQANYTECPGDAFYALLPAVRANVARRVGATIVPTLGVSSPLISPNGDGVLDTVDLTIAVGAPADWRLALQDAGGQTIGGWSGQGDAATLTWDGTTGGDRVPDGVYTAVLTAGTDAASTTATITVDTAAPRLASAAAAPLTFSPNGDARAETTTVTYAPVEACSVRVGILDASGDIVRWLHGWHAQKARQYSAAWDGLVTSGGGLVPAPDGQYRFDIERRDAGGNIARQGVKITLDRTLGFPTATPVTISPDGNGRRDQSTVGFTLSRTATVAVTIRLGDEALRTIDLGSLPAGPQTFVWDGKDDAGASLGSCRPAATITAVSSIGESTVLRGFVVDRYRPRLYATRGKAVSLGGTVKMFVKIVDPFSSKVDLRYTIRDARGRRAASAHPGYVRSGKALAIRWKPKKRGVFRVVFRATDLGANTQVAPASTRVIVR